MTFQPDYTHFVNAVCNHRPRRLPLYEHIICPEIMEQILDVSFASLADGDQMDLDAFFGYYCDFWRRMTYDTVSFEITVTDLLPGHGAIIGGVKGPIQSRRDFENYPWDELPTIYWQTAEKHFAALARTLPEGMKAVGGIGNGVFEISEDLVGMEYLAYLQMDDSELYLDLYQRIGDLLVNLWQRLLQQFGDIFAVCRIGDDLGFKSGTLISPATIRTHILPQYRRILQLIQNHDKPFLWHSCGSIFDIMDDMIDLGINAKHSNEDQIAPFDRWIELYSDRIGLIGGIDVNILCQQSPRDVCETVVDRAKRFRQQARGFALGSGNSIPDYVPVEGYLAMIDAAHALRATEQQT